MRFKKKVKILGIYLLSSTFFYSIICIEISAIATNINSQNNVNSTNNHNSLLINTYKINSSQNQQILKRALKKFQSNLEKPKKLPKLIIADVIPIEEYKDNPAKPPAEDEEKPQPDIIQPSNSNPAKPYTLQQQLLIQKLRRTKKQQQVIQKKIIIDALSSSANRYPWITNPTDNLTFKPQLFKPNKDENYIDTDLSIRFSEDNEIIEKFTYGKFPESDQFYWVLDNNRLVIETKGTQAGILYQGRASENYSTQNMTSTQAFWGLQSLNTLPVNFDELMGEAGVDNFSIVSIAGQIINPEGVPAGRVIINSGVNPEDPNVTILRNPTTNLGSGSTLSSQGGGALFDLLDATNTPRIIQAFPTTNLKPLLDGGNVRLQLGEIIPNSALEAAGIFWGDILTGEGFGFTAPVSSLPGAKIAQRGRFDNFDLLNIAVNPYLTPLERNLSYLNSLFWVSFGKRDPQFEIVSQAPQRTSNWHRLYASYPHNRTIIQYDPEKISANYSNVFASPGFSITANFNDFSIDGIQTVNSTLGLALGGIFNFVKIDNLDESLAEARERFKNGDSFAELNTKSTPNQRRQINNRLNRTLAYSNAASNLEQVSGNMTIESKITPNNSSILTLRTGNHKRAVQFLQRDIQLLDPGDTFFSTLRLSNERFGPLTFIGNQIPLNNTGIDPVNESSAAEVILTNSQGRQFVQKFSSVDNTIVPLPVRTFDLAFDYFELTRVDLIGVSFNRFNGYLSLPSVELLAAGSSGDLNYSASLGTWFNVDAQSAPGVSNNNLGLPEPSIGIYFSALANYIKTHVQLDANKKPVAINTHVPSLQINWNSASNANNPFSAVLSYYFNRQQKYLSFSLAPAIAFIQENSNGELLGLFSGELSTSTGLNINANLEFGENLFYELKGLQRISTNFSLGAYIKNYATINVGLNSRVSGLNYGLIFRHQFPDNNVFIESLIGTGENGFDMQIKGGYRF
ncbi:hypothetical protein H6G94_04705 [Nostoc punctiforme FACHB-252]|jgi:hypothetical protein|uniref:Uncharacterized protein n=1 Tax=Nostoc punctiforme FACHB-252 TaxID=1357509 RepID=A0ABR8H4P2_NOSPU|nr:hypothetical protein [Nostoc punctiforme]MBD2610579.1 hypothetical protein [Nostoc punctiforme FACHB-252]